MVPQLGRRTDRAGCRGNVRHYMYRHVAIFRIYAPERACTRETAAFSNSPG